MNTNPMETYDPIHSPLDNNVFPVVILGGGPIGLFAVFMCGMMHLKCCIIESLPTLGGQCQALYPDKPIYDIPGIPEISAQDLILNLHQQMEPFQPKVFCGMIAQDLVQDASGIFHITTSTGKIIRSRAVIICCGAGALIPKRPPIEHIERFEGKSIFYAVPPSHGWEGKNIVIAGGGDSAVDWALLLAPIAQSLHIVHRRTKFSAQEHNIIQLEKELQSGRIQCHTPYQLGALEGQENTLHTVHIHRTDGQRKRLSADILLPFFGMQNDLGPLSQWGLNIDNQRIMTNPLTGQTNRPGIYAAGDIAIYPHKLKLIMTGFSEIAQIAHHVKGYLFPDQFSPFKHSTTLGSPKNWTS